MDPVATVERAMVTIRRLQTRRTLAGGHDPTVTLVVDALEELGPSTVTEIAAALAVDQPRASRLVAHAVTEGAVTRGADQTDGRRVVLSLTPAGLAHAEAVHEKRRAAFGQAMESWSAADRVRFATLLDTFVDSYRAARGR
ncbi:MarR family winged helix-turn-helix transcriptional regulator [Actinokineospora inagensis]|uniref:MarR family winged helix-turn-helix transcriptional regulator n=1 Tax=Actinokineospora inagensis TaxID=103730 RepID=UPI00041B6623|nr:MarR family transcriptional regulator [Actinokineospora inagensis]